MATVNITIENHTVKIDSVDEISEWYTLETNHVSNRTISTKKTSKPRIMKEFTLRRIIKAGITASDLHKWYLDGSPKNIEIKVGVTDADGKDVTAYTIKLAQVRPIRWFFEFIDEANNANDQAYDCLVVIAEGIAIE